MTENEAIKILDEIQAINDSLTQYIPNFDEAIDISKKALEKQNEKKPKFYNANYYCPDCGKLVGCYDLIMKWNNKYCMNCGQKISWRELNDYTMRHKAKEKTS